MLENCAAANAETAGSCRSDCEMATPTTILPAAASRRVGSARVDAASSMMAITRQSILRWERVGIACDVEQFSGGKTTKAGHKWPAFDRSVAGGGFEPPTSGL